MSFDVLESLNAALGGPVTRQLSALLGESEDTTRSAVRATGPSLLAGLMQQATTPSGAADVFRVVNDDRIDAGIAGKLGGILGNRGAADALRGSGESLLGSVLGNRSGALTSALSQVSGMRPNSALSLLSLGLPLLLGMLRKQTTANGLDASGLASLLFSQRRSLEKTGLDSRITNALGVDSLSSLLGAVPGVSAAQSTVARTAAPLREERERKRGVWLPWALTAAIAAIALLVLFNRSGDHRTAPTTATTMGTDTQAGKRVRLAEADTTTRVYFGTGATSIDSTDRSKIAGIAQHAKQQDRIVAVTGYTDQTGDVYQNLEIAKQRAEAVRQALVAEGVTESRIVMDPPSQVTGSGSDAEARRVDIAVR